MLGLAGVICWLEGLLSGARRWWVRSGGGCPLVNVVGPGCRAALVVPEAGLVAAANRAALRASRSTGVGMEWSASPSRWSRSC